MDILGPQTSEEIRLRHAVTPGVAGSSPVHSANNANEDSHLRVAVFISGSETLEYAAEERGAMKSTKLGDERRARRRHRRGSAFGRPDLGLRVRTGEALLDDERSLVKDHMLVAVPAGTPWLRKASPCDEASFCCAEAGAISSRRLMKGI